MKKLWVLILCVFLLISLPFGFSDNVNHADMKDGEVAQHLFRRHFVYCINGNKELYRFVKEYKFAGMGTVSAPYEISLNILDFQSGIYFGNISRYFVIRDAALSDPQGDCYGSMGIVFYNVTHGKIKNVTVYNFRDEDITSIYLLKSSFVSVENVHIYTRVRASVSVGIYKSSHISLSDIFSNNVGIGIVSIYSDNISVSNAVYLSRGAAGMMLGYSENVCVSKCKFYGAGISLISDLNITVKNSRFVGNNSGIYNVDSYKIYVLKNIFAYNRVGIELDGLNSPVHDNIIERNVFAYSGEYGIHAENDGSNWIYDNIFLKSRAWDDGYIKTNDTWNYIYATTSFWNSSTNGNYWYSWANKNSSNDANHDDIVDYPYKIPGNAHAEDNFPLKHAPFSFSLPSSCPVNLKLTVGGGAAQLSWHAPAFNGTGKINEYRIYRNGELIATVNMDITHYTDEKYSDEDGYFVVAVSDAGMSAPSNEVYVKEENEYSIYAVISAVILTVVVLAAAVKLMGHRDR